MEKVYACIDLKSFYASVECVERKLNPLTTNLVVADSERTEKTICLAVSPSLKSYGLKGRSRLYEVIERVKEVNNERKKNIKTDFTSKSFNNNDVLMNPYVKLDYITARPRMGLYMKYSTKIYNIYLKYLDVSDIFAYSIDEVFCDLTNYLKYRKMTPEELVTKMILDVIKETGITATAGIGTNMYLAKIAMDIMAKHAPPNEYDVRIYSLNEEKYRKELWNHTPLTDFWRVGPGISAKLIENKIYTMGDICELSIKNENKLYDLFGVNAELLIDHAWGYEPCTISDVKKYRPSSSSLSRGQVLSEPYDYQKTKLIIAEMADLLSLDLVEHHYVTNQLVLTIGYDTSNVDSNYQGRIVKDRYGRNIPKHDHGTINIDHFTSSSKVIIEKTMELYDRIINPKLLTRRMSIAACNLKDYSKKDEVKVYEQFDLFSDNSLKEKQKEEDKINENKENDVQKAILEIKKKYGKNAILKGMNLMKGAKTIERNGEIGGHRA